MRRALANFAVFALASGCVISTDYGNTSFRCEVGGICPGDYICVAGQCVLPGNQDASIDAPPAQMGFQFRRQLSVTAGAIATPQTNVPVLIALDSTRIRYADMTADGHDIEFRTIDDQPLAHEIESWDPNGRSLVWVLLPNLAADTLLWMYYADAMASDSQRPADVWANYQVVFHLSDGADSSPSGFDATAVGPVPGPAMLGGGYEFDGVDDYMMVGTGLPLLQAADQVTVSAWLRPDEARNAASLTTSVNGATTSRMFLEMQGPVGEPILGIRTLDGPPSITLLGPATLPLTEWTWVVATANFAAGTAEIYTNGALATSATGLLFEPAMPDTTSDITVIGINETLAGAAWLGGQDEVRLAATAFDADWIATQYASMTDALLTFGAEEPAP